MSSERDETAATGRCRERLTMLAGSLAVGIAIGAWQGRAALWPWSVTGAAALALALGASMMTRGRVRGAVPVLIALATLCFGTIWFTVRQHVVAADDIAAGLDDAPALLRVRGVALEPPRLRDRSAGSMAAFSHRPPATWFLLRVTALLARDGRETPARGTVAVRVQETLAPFHAGDRVDAVGLLYPPMSPGNPGEFDSRRYARSRGRSGMLDVARRELITVQDRRGALTGLWRRTRAELRGRATGWLLADLPQRDRGQRDALLAALLLGRRGPALDDLGETFRHAGLSHFLAISGLHLGVLAGFVLFLARLGGRSRRWHGWLVIVVVLVYLVVVDVRMPVLRAGLMTIAASAGLAAGRRFQVGGLVAASAIALLLWRPDELFTPGFQLSYGVVLGLVHLSPLVRRRFFGRPDALSSSSAEMAGQWLRTTGAVAVTAWAVASPITLYHWGVVWPLAAPFSVLVLPAVTLVLALGYVKIVLAVVLPSASLLAALPLSLGTDVLLALVRTMDAVPLSAVQLVHAPAAWSVAAIGWFCGFCVLGDRIWGFWGGRWGRRTLTATGAVLLAWLLWPLLLPGGAHVCLRMDVLAVGDGTCIALRSGPSTVLFDAGSSSDLNAGRRLIVPALRRLGVRSIDALLISHPNLDHYSAGLEIVEAFDVGTVLVTPQLEREAQIDPYGPVMHFLAGLADRDVPVLAVAAGEGRTFGSCRWTWLHPDGEARYEQANDGSMVIRIEAGKRPVLLCGDIQRGAMTALAEGPGGIPVAAIAELPHHGSAGEHPEAFMAAVDPQVVFQSTGRSRMQRTGERWAAALPEVRRLATARDGACRIEVDRDGKIRVMSFRSRRWEEYH